MDSDPTCVVKLCEPRAQQLMKNNKWACPYLGLIFYGQELFDILHVAQYKVVAWPQKKGDINTI
jgi:hypothetical protein